jgi:hypothetical protein
MMKTKEELQQELQDYKEVVALCDLLLDKLVEECPEARVIIKAFAEEQTKLRGLK